MAELDSHLDRARLRRLENLRASEIPVEPIPGLLNADGSDVQTVQQALERLAVAAGL